MNNSQRTQIILPKDLREKVDQVISKTGESMAQYLRRAAVAQLEREQNHFADLKKLANDVIGSVSNKSLSKDKVLKWQRQMRKDRD